MELVQILVGLSSLLILPLTGLSVARKIKKMLCGYVDDLPKWSIFNIFIGAFWQFLLILNIASLASVNEHQAPSGYLLFILLMAIAHIGFVITIIFSWFSYEETVQKTPIFFVIAQVILFATFYLYLKIYNHV